MPDEDRRPRVLPEVQRVKATRAEEVRLSGCPGDSKADPTKMRATPTSATRNESAQKLRDDHRRRRWRRCTVS